jgi:hypothetical protein
MRADTVQPSRAIPGSRVMIDAITILVDIESAGRSAKNEVRQL